MTGAEILGALLWAAGESIAVNLAGRTTGGLADWVIQHLERQRQNRLSRDEKDKVHRVIDRDRSMAIRAMAQLRFADRRGILVIGPSGAGKSALIRGLTEKIIRPTTSPTGSTEKKFVYLGGRYVAIRDTPGLVLQGSPGSTDTFNASRHFQPKILIIVMANGFLHTSGTAGLRRPYPGSQRQNLEDYLAATKQEECEWLQNFTDMAETPRRRIEYFLLVVNKMDIWYEHRELIAPRYQEGEFQTLLDLLALKIGRPDSKFQIVTCSSVYDSFANRKSPSPEMNLESSRISLDLLKAILHIRYTDGRI